jgi:hypothetical protein
VLKPYSLIAQYMSCFTFFYLFNLLLCFLVFLSGDVELNPGLVRGRACEVLFCNIRGLHANLDDLRMVSRGLDVRCLAETLVTARRHASEHLLQGFSSPIRRLSGSGPGFRGMALYIRDGFPAFRQSTYESMVLS